MSEAAIELDSDNCVVVVIENHNCQPQMLGMLHSARLYAGPEEGSEIGQGSLVAPVRETDFVETRLECLNEGLKVDVVHLKSWRAGGLQEFDQ